MGMSRLLIKKVGERTKKQTKSKEANNRSGDRVLMQGLANDVGVEVQIGSTWFWWRTLVEVRLLSPVLRT